MSNILVNRVVPALLLLMAIAVFGNLILTPVYHNGSADYPVWDILNWPMAAGVIIAMIAASHRNRAAKAADPDSMRSLRASLVFYGAIVLTMIYFWNWFWTLNPDSETGGAVTSHLVHFPMTDALYTVMGLVTAKYLWREGK